MTPPKTIPRKFRDLSGTLLKPGDIISYMVDLVGTEIRYGQISEIKEEVMHVLGVDNEVVCMHLLSNPKAEQMVKLDKVPTEIQYIFDRFVIDKTLLEG